MYKAVTDSITVKVTTASNQTRKLHKVRINTDGTLEALLRGGIMALGLLLAAVWFILYGITTMGWVAISPQVLAIVALIAGILLIVDGYGLVRR